MEDKVVDSRTTKEGEAIRRRRECTKCGKRYTTYEYIERAPLIVVKKDGRREQYDREKLLTGLIKACEKRPVARKQLEGIIDDVEGATFGKFKNEVKTTDLGNEVIERLQHLDEVAYVRFASVYRQFKDINQFMKELKTLLDKTGSDNGKSGSNAGGESSRRGG
jgi:transcriptional repressor NrdR